MKNNVLVAKETKISTPVKKMVQYKLYNYIN